MLLPRPYLHGSADDAEDGARTGGGPLARADHMVFTAFVSASVTKGGLTSWMHNRADRGILDANFYIHLAQDLERSGFDLMFFDDRLAMPAAYQGSVEETIKRGSRAIKLDLITILGMLSGHTERIGLGGTYSTTYSSPFHVARMFATLDHLSGGRAVWNIVTSLNEDEAANFGTEYLNPDQRYDRADEFIRIVTQLWESWDEDALEMDRATGRFAKPGSVHRIDFEGEFLSSRGPLTVPRPPQGWPTLLQAGQSGRGQQFAARWADVVFTSQHNLDTAAAYYARMQEQFRADSRPDGTVKILPAVLPIVGETQDIAKAKEAYFDSLFEPGEQLVTLSEQANFDFAKLPMDEPLTDELLDTFTGTKGSLQGYVKGARIKFGENATLNDVIESRRKQGGARFVGDPMQVADGLEQWFQGHGCDGFAIMATDMPGSFEDFGRLVIPELRRRGLVAEDPARQGTLRERLGLQQRA
jgi:FMN-dependent oxidoreductase (nitrilotriacetate monooxygenase family)